MSKKSTRFFILLPQIGVNGQLIRVRYGPYYNFNHFRDENYIYIGLLYCFSVVLFFALLDCPSLSAVSVFFSQTYNCRINLKLSCMSVQEKISCSDMIKYCILARRVDL